MYLSSMNIMGDEQQVPRVTRDASGLNCYRFVRVRPDKEADILK